jgi:hypothetical protein
MNPETNRENVLQFDVLQFLRPFAKPLKVLAGMLAEPHKALAGLSVELFARLHSLLM